MKLFTTSDARAAILRKVAKAGAKGAAALFTPSTAEPKRTLLEQAAEELEREEALFIDRRKAKPRYFAWEHRPQLPTAEQVAGRLEDYAVAAWPAVTTRALWKAALKKQRDELPLLEPALALLLEQGRVLALQHRKGQKTEELFIPRRTLPTLPGPAPAPFAPEPVRRAYAALAASTGFSAVAISALQQESGAPLAPLKAWLKDEHLAGRAILSRGDWSLAGEDKRLAAIEWQGQAYLLVRLPT